MQRIQTADGRFLAGNPQTGTPGTVVTSKFMNDMQDEICNVIEAAGFELDGEKQNQLHEAIAKLLTDAAPKAATEVILGLVRIATTAQAQALANDSVVLTPKKLSDILSSKDITLGEGLSGDGRILSGATIALGTPSTLNGDTENSVTDETHSHKLADATENVAGVTKIASSAHVQGLSGGGVVTSSRLGEAFNAYVPGMGQAWQNVTANRNFNTTYTNSTSRPILIVHSVGDDGGTQFNNTLSYLVGNETVALYNLQKDSSQIGGIVVTFAVPSGSTYRINVTRTSNLSGVHWAELR